MYQQGKPEAEYVLWDSTNLTSVQFWLWNGSKCLASEEVKISDLTT